ncbi:MAG TPA: hypothetical protein VJW73_12175, partial [Gemmatimonadaceae bacterium]|nr:hypothetical protein [Gemmatimonadaceae bacterium]
AARSHTAKPPILNIRMSQMRPISVVLAMTIAAAGCAGKADTAQAPLTHPAELVGRWVRFREDSTWGDTLQYLADGRVLGSEGHAVPAEARWGVKPGPLGSQEFCAADDREGYCQTFHFQDSVMVVGGGPEGPSYFRRAT